MAAPWYVTRHTLKAALGIDASTTGKHALLDMAIEDVSRQFEKYTGFGFQPVSGTRFYTPTHSDCQPLDSPLLAVDSIQTSSDGGSTYGTTMATNSYYLTPYNATMESPKQPFWGIELKSSCATAVFPAGVQRGARITGTWGYYDERITSTATLASGPNSTQRTLDVHGSTSIRAGMTLLIDSERVFVEQDNASSTGSVTSGVTVQRGVGGTAAAAHSSGATIQIYQYPTVEKAALFQAEQDYRSFDAPLGFAGGEPFGNQPVRPGGGAGLHPFVTRVLDRFREPVAR